MRTGLILVAAGYGSLRLLHGRPVPKILEPIHGTPMVVHPIRTALEAGITDIVVVVNDLFGRDIRKAIRMHGPVCEPEFVVQPDRYGSANAVLRALP
ncbi:MAG TPA: NTP transferase domain-containing protein, partial [Candidatus Paceibacterota bacterium]|nr:NTP transferase domain-containing protein [Candidatus Paceibacterota bacterium]